MIRLSLLSLLLTISNITFGQFKNILLDPGSTESKTGKVSIAIDQNNPKIMVATSAPNNIYSTSDGGFSWRKSLVASPANNWSNPAVISDFKGNFYYFQLSDSVGKKRAHEGVFDRIVTHGSSDGGNTWKEAYRFGLNSPKNLNKEQVTSDRKGNLYVTWTQFDKYKSNDSLCQSNILLSMSSNGKKWSKPVQISQTGGNCNDDDNTSSGATPAAFGDGSRVFVSWVNQEKIFLDRSFDGGKTWLTNDITVADLPGGWELTIPGIGKSSGAPVLVCGNTKKGDFVGALYMIWADQRNGENDSDIWFTRSMNFGDNWTSPSRINNDPKGKHQFQPWIAIDPSTGYLYIMYYDRREYDDFQTDVYVAYSTDAGASFRNVKISEKPFISPADTFMNGNNNISAANGIITPTWTSVENGQTAVWTAVIKHEEFEKKK